MYRSKHPIEVSGAIWLQKPGADLLGDDRIRLLEKIEEHGSITKAARAAGISYKTAWDNVSAVTNLSEKPLVRRMTGGKGGGGARVTEAGERAIKLFWRFHDDLQRFLKREQAKLLPNLARKRSRS